MSDNTDFTTTDPIARLAALRSQLASIAAEVDQITKALAGKAAPAEPVEQPSAPRRPDYLWPVAGEEASPGEVGQRGRPRGEQHRLAKLTEEAVREIRKSPHGKLRLAKRYGVDPSTIRAVRNGETWRHVA